MSDFALAILHWQTVEDPDPVLRESTGWLEIRVGGTALTRNEDVWSRTVRDSVLVSGWPLAMWLAHYWWRLNYEPLPYNNQLPAPDWRMAHELGAADHGYVWPRILFASDGEVVQVWAESLPMPGQSVQYLAGLDGPQSVPLTAFQSAIEGFVDSVLDRLAAVGQENSDLAGLWSKVARERADLETARRRQLEAQLGFDPGQCPGDLLAALLDLIATTGHAAMVELAPAYGPQRDMPTKITALRWAQGIEIAPQVEPFQAYDSPLPWQQGVAAARNVRDRMGDRHGPVRDEVLDDLLGIAQRTRLDEVTDRLRPVSVMRPDGKGRFIFLPRKRHPTSHRFELARILGDWVTVPQGGDEWRVSSDVVTARQKRQRAFAAEFLCPIDALVQFLDGDYSDDAIEAASQHFAVSEWTIRSLLANNGYIPRCEPALPYRLQG